jgi:hypothetical protein
MATYPDGTYVFGFLPNLNPVTLVNGRATEGDHVYELVVSDTIELEPSGDVIACSLIKKSFQGSARGEFFLFAFRRVRNDFALLASVLVGSAERGAARVFGDGTLSGETFDENGNIDREVSLNCNFFKIPR